MIVIIAVGVIFGAIMYQPYGECIALNEDLQERLKTMTIIADKIGTQNEAYYKLAESYDLKKAEYVASCRALM